MSETAEVIGRINITFQKNGQPRIEIMGELPKRQYNALPIYLRRAVRKHTALLRRGSGHVDMSDKGRKVSDLSEEELTAMNNLEATAGADELNVTPPPVHDSTNEFKRTQAEEAKEPNPESEAPDGTNSGTEEVREDDEGPGDAKSHPWEL